MLKARFPVAMTGAGISVAAGLPTFDTLWRGIPIRKILSRDYALMHAYLFWDCYRDRGCSQGRNRLARLRLASAQGD